MPLSFQTAAGVSASTVVLQLAKNLKPNAGDLRYAGERQRGRMVQRTGRGIDVDGSGFTAYTSRYADRKAKSGRDSGVVDLTWSGRMLKAMVISRVTDSSFVIGIYNDEGLRAAVHDGGLGKMPTRHFMGASATDQRSMSQDIEARILARANGTGLNIAA